MAFYSAPLLISCETLLSQQGCVEEALKTALGCAHIAAAAGRLEGVSLKPQQKQEIEEISRGEEEMTKSKDLMKSQSLKLAEVICFWRRNLPLLLSQTEIPSVSEGDSSPFYL